jgi:hypothetical protein
VRKAAVEHLTDQNVLADIAKNATDSDVRKAAVERVTDGGLLVDIARNDKGATVRREVADALIKIAGKGRGETLQRDVAEVLIDIARKSPHFLRDHWDMLATTIQHADRNNHSDKDCGAGSHSDLIHGHQDHGPAAYKGLAFPPKPRDF